MTFSSVRLFTISCALIFSSLPIYSQILVDTFAGGHIVSGVAAQSAPLGQIAGVTRDPSGNVVFCDSNVIRRMNADGTIQTIAGTGIPGFGGDGGPALSALLWAPRYPKYDKAGNLYFADLGNLRIRRIDPSGVITTLAGTGILGTLGTGGPALRAQIGVITDLVLDSSGYIYFAESGEALLRRVTASGQMEVFAGCTTCNDVDGAPATQSAIQGGIVVLALDSQGNLYVGGRQHVYRISTDGIIYHFAGFGTANFGPQFGNGGPALAAPNSNFVSLTADAGGNVYTEELTQYDSSLAIAIRRIGTGGTINVIAGSYSGNPLTNDGPALQVLLFSGGGSALSSDSGGTLTFADDQLIRQLTTQATIQTIAGGNPQLAPDGTAALRAWFVAPTTMAIDHLGNIYVAEQCAIREIDSAGTLSTVAGTEVCSSVATPVGPALSTEINPVASIAFDSADNLYFTDFEWAYEVASGTITALAQLDLSSQLAIDSEDHVYYTNGAQTGLIQSNGSTEVIETLPSGITGTSITVDAKNNIYVCCDFLNGFHIVEFGPTFQVISTAIPVELPTLPHNMAFDSSGNLWQSEPIVGFYKGSTPFGGSCCVTPYGDGGPVESAYTSPASFAFAPNGDLYFLDSLAGHIRRIHGSPPSVAPSISAGGIVNAASLAGGTVAPGELISIFGSNFGPSGLDVATPLNNTISGALNNVHVYFIGPGETPGAITARTQNQINVFVPYEVASQTSVQVIVDVDGVTSTPVTVPVASSAFGLSTTDASGLGKARS